MSFYVYVLFNSVSRKFYKGQTENLAKRLAEHAKGHTKTTSIEKEHWELVYVEELPTREAVLKREKYFKSAGGRKFLKIKIGLGSLVDSRPNVRSV